MELARSGPAEDRLELLSGDSGDLADRREPGGLKPSGGRVADAPQSLDPDGVEESQFAGA